MICFPQPLRLLIAEHLSLSTLSLCDKEQTPSTLLSTYLRKVQPYSEFLSNVKPQSLQLCVRTQVCNCSPDSHILSQATSPAALLGQRV